MNSEFEPVFDIARREKALDDPDGLFDDSQFMYSEKERARIDATLRLEAYVDAHDRIIEYLGILDRKLLGAVDLGGQMRNTNDNPAEGHKQSGYIAALREVQNELKAITNL